MVGLGLLAVVSSAACCRSCSDSFLVCVWLVLSCVSCGIGIELGLVLLKLASSAACCLKCSDNFLVFG